MLDMELIGEDGPFHQVELKRAATVSTAEVGTEQEASDSEPEDDNDNHTVTELRQLGEENDHLKERVSELEAQLAKVTTRMKSLWKANCSLSREFEETLEEKDAEIECLKHQLSDLQSEASSTTLTTSTQVGTAVTRVTPVVMRGQDRSTPSRKGKACTAGGPFQW